MNSPSLPKPQAPLVKRKLTAIRRSNLSRPVQLLLETGVADEMQRLATDFPQEWEAYVGFLADCGRPPARVESALLDKAATRRISTKALLSWTAQQVGSTQLETAAESSKNDLLVFLAMSLFENRTKFSDLDTTAQSDIARPHQGAYLGHTSGHRSATPARFNNGTWCRTHATGCSMGGEYPRLGSFLSRSRNFQSILDDWT
jgi:hypothetical protein